MDTVGNMQNESSPENKENNKRRSVVFKRRTIAYEPDQVNADATDVGREGENLKSDEENKSKSFDIAQYIESLNVEDKNWREVYSKRKSRVRDFIKRNKNQSKQPLDITVLSDEQRKFLSSKPDYKEFYNNLLQLRTMAIQAAFLNAGAKHFYDNTISKLQEDTNSAVHRISELVD